MSLPVSSYLQLTKPRIVLLVLVTALASLVMEGSLLHRPWQFLLVLCGITMVAGSANAFNQYFERDLDAQMARTRTRRPLPLNQVSPGNALAFAIALGALSVALLFLIANPLSAWLALGTILFYGFGYTLWLKPRTVHNIVIGGAAGAMGPVIAWAAASGGLALAPILLFLVIFLWTPPHFWALALCVKEDYRAVRIPMLPLVRGDAETYRQIEIYSIALVALTLAMPFLRTGGLIYALLALGLGGVFVWKAVKARRLATVRSAWDVFGFSILYLFVLFLGLIADAIWRIPIL
ncbi:MAG: protoheme IX farnesyltransferase [Candidatus Eisenbacteria bacterium]|uniref:Protoheme IX farnesyltransferase n=1 Tax=Eiseniibacteriota bacterium TaxID=2212470 RepID=A0A538SMB3_UNCEI|nr:MAG: protoheme IX farnesyltransferase [Candidatus Eisenbacteria bacterium]TMQ64075.1 MAG: protoheme IX farnesyltransferase [Candidatus Eisenbacteria bacterium]